MTVPTSIQDAGTETIASVAAAINAARERVPGAIRFARRAGLDDAQIREAFTIRGVDFADLLAALEVKA